MIARRVGKINPHVTYNTEPDDRIWGLPLSCSLVVYLSLMVLWLTPHFSATYIAYCHTVVHSFHTE